MPTAIQTITAETIILKTRAFAIFSNSNVLAPISQTITSTSNVLVTQEQLIQAGAQIKEPIFLHVSAQVDVPDTEDMDIESEVLNPVPSAPTSLVAVDAGKGDVVNLNWVSSASFFNVYRKDGIILTKLNPTILEDVTSYSAGGLTPDVAVIFVVKAANGLGDESPASNEATATPTFQNDIYRFTEPVWEVKVNGNVIEDAILADVNLSYGSNFSTASFTLPRDPRTSGNPELNDEVEIIVNSKLIFKGIITNVTKNIDSSGLTLAYTCNSNIIDLTKFTLTETGLNGGISRFNILESCPDGSVSLKARANANTIVASFGISEAPNVYPGYIDVTDLTPLAAAELVLSRIGNYRVYHDMETGENSVYAFGSGGFSVREFTIGKNILEYNIRLSDMDVITKVEVIGAPIKKRFKKIVNNFSFAKDENGRLRAKIRVVGKNIRDIQVFGNIREKPEITFDESIQVTLNDFQDLSSLSNQTFNQLFEDFENSFRANSVFAQPIHNDADPDLVLRPAIKKIQNFKIQRQPVASKISYVGCDTVDIFLNEIPKKWFPYTKTGYVKRSAISGDLSNPDEKVQVSVLLDYQFLVSSAEIEYTVDDNPPVAISGTGTPSKSITDSQYQVVIDTIQHTSNLTSVLNQMSVRANSELARLNKPIKNGTITILGDELVDLRSSIRDDGDILEISGVRHSFTNGFTTTVELTNEPFFRTIVFAPSLSFGNNNNSRQEEKNKKGLTITYNVTNLAEVAKELQAETDKINKEPKESGPFTVLQ